MGLGDVGGRSVSVKWSKMSNSLEEWGGAERATLLK